jgi:hypothetical protein
VEVSACETFIRALAKRMMRFVWSDVGQNVLKIVCENGIGTDTRKMLGEYYMQDWLAEVINRLSDGAVPIPVMTLAKGAFP